MKLKWTINKRDTELGFHLIRKVVVSLVRTVLAWLRENYLTAVY